MEENKKGKGGIVVLIILLVMALGVAGLFAYNYFSGAGCSKCNVPEDEEKIIMELVEEEMENAMELKVPLLAESESGHNWLEVK